MRNGSRSGPRRYQKYKLQRTPREQSLTFNRWSGPISGTCIAGVVSFYADAALNNLDTSDIAAAFDLYRINSVTACVTPLVDPANSGLVNNHVLQIYLAEDIYGEFTTPTYSQITGFANCKMRLLGSGQQLWYKFKPRVKNTVDNAGTAVPVGSYGRVNPWINTSTAGLSIPHKRLLVYVNDPAGTFTGTVYVTLRYNITVRGLQ